MVRSQRAAVELPAGQWAWKGTQFGEGRAGGGLSAAGKNRPDGGGALSSWRNVKKDIIFLGFHQRILKVYAIKGKMKQNRM